MDRVLVVIIVCSAFLISIAVNANTDCSDAKEMWVQVAKSDSRELIQSYIQQYPNCPLFMTLARKKLDSISESSDIVPLDLSRDCHKSAAMIGQFQDIDTVEFTDISFEKTQSACLKALDAVPNDVHSQIVYARALLKAGLNEQARRNLQQGVSVEDGFALSLMGTYYKSVNQYDKAISFFERSARSGNSYGYVNMAIQYRAGSGVKQDYSKAREFFQLALEKRHIVHVDLAHLYQNGLGGPQDFDKAIELYEEYIRLGGTQLDNLAHLYHKQLPNKDIKKAVEYYTIAAQNGSDWSMNRLGMIYADEPAFLDETKALFWLGKAIEKENQYAAFNLGRFYKGELKVGKVDHSKKIGFFKLAVKFGNVDAYRMLGYFYYTGEGVRSNIEIAQDYYEAGALRGSVMSQRALGKIYLENGNIKMARHWFQKAADQGDEVARKLMAKLDK